MQRPDPGQFSASLSPRWRDYPLPQTGGPGKITLLTVPVGAGRQKRDLVVALPPDAVGRQGHPVVYLHDGQNLFDSATSHAGDWGLVRTLNRLATQGVEAIVVGIPHRGRRRRDDYNPFRDRFPDGGGGDRYLDLAP